MLTRTDKTLVWDLPTRVFHWLLVASFIGAYATGEAERWRELHAMLGYTVAGLVAFRLLWGVMGTRYARFAAFPLSPRAVAEYLGSLLSTAPRHYFGHNPAGSWAILLMLAMLLAVSVSGWAVFVERGPRALDDVHEALANAMLVLVLVHVAAVALSSWLHAENLVRSMLDGNKRGRGPAAAGTRWAVALLLAGLVGAFWGGQIPAPGLTRGAHLLQAGKPQLQSNDAVRERRSRRRIDD